MLRLFKHIDLTYSQELFDKVYAEYESDANYGFLSRSDVYDGILRRFNNKKLAEDVVSKLFDKTN